MVFFSHARCCVFHKKVFCGRFRCTDSGLFVFPQHTKAHRAAKSFINSFFLAAYNFLPLPFEAGGEHISRKNSFPSLLFCGCFAAATGFKFLHTSSSCSSFSSIPLRRRSRACLLPGSLDIVHSRVPASFFSGDVASCSKWYCH